MKSTFKRTTSLVSILLLFAVCFMMFGCDVTSDNSQGTEKVTNETTQPVTQSPEAATPGNNSTLGDFEVVILGCRIAEDYQGAPVVIVKYQFTNNDNDPSAFMWSIEDDVYQGGIGLNTCYVVEDSANYSSDNQSKEIKKGTSLDVEVAYVLNDTTTDIEVEVSEYLSFSNKKITKTFSLS